MIQAHLVRAAISGISLAFGLEPDIYEEWQNPPEFDSAGEFAEFTEHFTLKLIISASEVEQLQD